MGKVLLKKRIQEEYAFACEEIKNKKLLAIPGFKGSPKRTFNEPPNKNWGLTTGKIRKNGSPGDITTIDRLMKMVNLNLISEENFANYKGNVSLHKLIGSNHSDAKYIMLFLVNRIKKKYPELFSDGNASVEFGVEENLVGTEGARKTVVINTYERNRDLRNKKIRECKGDCRCSICGFNFEEIYGDIGKNFIHVHHLHALSDIGTAHKVSLDDLILVCPNCHAMLHHRNPMYKPEDIKALINKGNESDKNN